MSKIIGAVEIGTSCAKALVGEVTEGKSLNIVGKSVRKNEGMRKVVLFLGALVTFFSSVVALDVVIIVNYNFSYLCYSLSSSSSSLLSLPQP